MSESVIMVRDLRTRKFGDFGSCLMLRAAKICTLFEKSLADLHGSLFSRHN